MIVVHHFYQVGGGEDEAYHRTVCGGVSLCGAVQGGQDVARPQEGRRDLVRRQRRHEQNSLDDVICTVNMQDVLLLCLHVSGWGFLPFYIETFMSTVKFTMLWFVK